MTNAEKAMLLSGLVFPGLGQLVLKCYVRGVALTLASFVCFYLLIENAVQQALAIVDKIDLSGGLVAEQVIAAVVSEVGKTADTGAITLVLLALMILWLIGIVDAYVIGSRKDRQGQSADRGNKNNKGTSFSGRPS